jgi:hypothetical protein
MTRISILLPAISLALACVSCSASVTHPKAKSSSRQAPPQPVQPMFHKAIVVRDEITTAFFGSLNPGESPPSTLAITFYDGGGAPLETLTDLVVQVSESGFVYAAPPLGVTRTRTSDNIKNAASASVMVQFMVQPVDLGQAVDTIAGFTSSYMPPPPPEGGYGGCPHCLTYFLCHCLRIRGKHLIEDVARCPVIDNSRQCQPISWWFE